MKNIVNVVNVLKENGYTDKQIETIVKAAEKKTDVKKEVKEDYAKLITDMQESIDELKKAVEKSKIEKTEQPEDESVDDILGNLLKEE